MFPPGRARLATWPVPTGSACIVKTMGIEDVAAFAACTKIEPRVTMRSTLSRTRSAASSGSRAELPSAQRDSIRMFLPSIQPRFPSSTRKPCHRRASDESEAFSPKIPMRYTFPAGASAANDAATSAKTKMPASPVAVPFTTPARNNRCIQSRVEDLPLVCAVVCSSGLPNYYSARDYPDQRSAASERRLVRPRPRGAQPFVRGART